MTPHRRCVPVFAPDGLEVLRWVWIRDSSSELARVDRMLVAIADAAQRSRTEQSPQAVARLLEEIAATAERGLLGLRDARAELARVRPTPPFGG